MEAELSASSFWDAMGKPTLVYVFAFDMGRGLLEHYVHKTD